jgi:hypothetical protein
VLTLETGMKNKIKISVFRYAERLVDASWWRRRVLDGEHVPTSDKIYSIFEPHTDLIKCGKVRAPVEFGHKVFLDAVGGCGSCLPTKRGSAG